jgi:regulator of sigma E protease
MEVLVMAGQLILGLSILVGLHELGHLLTAKLFGMRVEQYSIGFPPKLFGFKMGETEYSLGAVPLGGYVKITGMIDESLDTEHLGSEPQPYEFRAKPAWQRLIVMMGGIIVNVITGVLVFIILLYAYGKSYLPASEAKHGIVAYSLAQDLGLRTGDKILKINGRPYNDFYAVRSPDVLLNNNSSYTVERNGQILTINIPPDLIEKLSDKNAEFIEPIRAFKVDTVMSVGKPSAFQRFMISLNMAKPAEEYPAVKAGLKSGDQIVSINDQSIRYFHELQQELIKNRGKKVTLGVVRSDELKKIDLKVTENAAIGFIPEFDLKYENVDYSLGMAIKEGPEMAFGVVRDNIKAFGKIFRGEVSASKSLSGPIGIAQIYGKTWDWYRFWSITGLLSMILAFMNFLPIPALDGGHVMFLTYEMVSGRSPSDKFLEVAQKVGMVILLSLMVFAFFNDIFKNFFA